MEYAILARCALWFYDSVKTYSLLTKQNILLAIHNFSKLKNLAKNANIFIYMKGDFKHHSVQSLLVLFLGFLSWWGQFLILCNIWNVCCLFKSKVVHLNKQEFCLINQQDTKSIHLCTEKKTQTPPIIFIKVNARKNFKLLKRNIYWHMITACATLHYLNKYPKFYTDKDSRHSNNKPPLPDFSAKW